MVGLRSLNWDGAAHELGEGEEDLQEVAGGMAARDEGRSLRREQEIGGTLRHVSCSPPGGRTSGRVPTIQTTAASLQYG